MFLSWICFDVCVRACVSACVWDGSGELRANPMLSKHSATEPHSQPWESWAFFFFFTLFFNALESVRNPGTMMIWKRLWVQLSHLLGECAIADVTVEREGLTKGSTNVASIRATSVALPHSWGRGNRISVHQVCVIEPLFCRLPRKGKKNLKH